jgi:hypothetical protein
MVFISLKIKSGKDVPARTLSMKTTKADLKGMYSNRSMKTSVTIGVTSAVLHTYGV